MQTEITRLRRIEAKADNSIREALVRRIRDLQSELQDISKAAERRNAA
jgi:hypothetical protein